MDCAKEKMWKDTTYQACLALLVPAWIQKIQTCLRSYYLLIVVVNRMIFIDSLWSSVVGYLSLEFARVQRTYVTFLLLWISFPVSPHTDSGMAKSFHSFHVKMILNAFRIGTGEVSQQAYGIIISNVLRCFIATRTDTTKEFLVCLNRLRSKI